MTLEHEPTEAMLENDPKTKSRSSRKQKITLVASYYVERLSPVRTVWSHDLHRWLTESDPKSAIPQPSLLTILNRLQEQELAVGLWEQFDKIVRRPPRKYHQLTELGIETAIHNLQELRANADRPSWIPIPELRDGNYLPIHPEGFEITPPEGRLIPEA